MTRSANTVERVIRQIAAVMVLAAVCLTVSEVAAEAHVISDLTKHVVQFAVWCGLYVPVLLLAFRESVSRRVWRAVFAGLVMVVLWRTVDVTAEIGFLDSVPLIGNDSRWRSSIERLALLGLGCATLAVFYGLFEEVVEARDHLEEKVDQLVRDMEARQVAEEALRQSERRFHALAETAPVGIIQTDAHGRCLYANQQWCGMAGISPESAWGRGWARTIDPADRRKAIRGLGNRQQDQRPFHTEFRFCRSDGSVLWVLGQAKAVKDNGTVVGFIGGCVDITESKIAENELQRLHGELEHVNRVASMGEIASAIAHELHQPLGSIANFAEGSAALVRKKGIGGDELTKILDEIASEALRAGEVTRSLRRFVAKTSPHRTALDINELVRRTSRLLEADAEDHQVRLRFDCGAHLPQMKVDAIQIQQVIVNLVRNAVEATAKPGHASGEVVVSTSRANGSVRVHVTDQGHGVAAEQMEKIWEPYFTTKADGLGMGLCIARRIVRANGGELSATANAQQGMTFEIRLPVSPSDGERNDG